MTNIVRLAIDKETRKRLRQIASLTDETIYHVVERLAIAEQWRLREEGISSQTHEALDGQCTGRTEAALVLDGRPGD